MKKISTMLVVILSICFSTTVLACPKGTHPHGGTGSHHKGGTCS